MAKRKGKHTEQKTNVFKPQDLKAVNQNKKEWFENEAFWENFGPIMFDSQRWAEAPVVAESIIKIAGLIKGCSVLEAGCGPGRIAVELAVKGMDVTGVDIIQSELEAAKETADAENVKLNLIKADLRSYIDKDKFDCIVNLYTSFGYCNSIEEDLKILKNIYESLKKSGFFIMEINSRETAIMYFTEGEWFERAGFTVLTDYKVSGIWEGLKSKWTLINSRGERIEHEYVQRLYSGIELKRMLLAIGFESVEVYGDFDFSPYDHKARTAVIVAKK